MIMKQSLYIFPLIAFLSCSGLFEEEPNNDPVGNFESIWSTFDQHYAVFQERGVDWNEQYSTFRPQVSKSTTDEQLYEIVTSLLASLDDGHVSLMAENKPFWSSKELYRTRERDLLFNLEVVVQEYLENYEVLNNQVLYGRGMDNIGYIYIGHLSDPIEIKPILEGIQPFNALIIDLRHNDGGDFTNAERIVSQFADQRRLAFTAQPKNGPGPGDFGQITEYYLKPSNSLFDGPIAVITDEYTISAGENMVLYLNTLPQVTTFGERTSGAMGERIEKEMPNGWVYSITGQLIKTPEGISYEGPGIPVDVSYVNRQSDIDNRIDSLYLTAHQFLLSEIVQ